MGRAFAIQGDIYRGADTIGLLKAVHGMMALDIWPSGVGPDRQSLRASACAMRK